MKIVGLRELKNRLNAYIREVRNGEIVIITDRGKAVARLQAVPSVSPDDPFYEMVLRGEVTPGRQLSPEEKKKLYSRGGPPVLRGITSAEILDELREETVLPVKGNL